MTDSPDNKMRSIGRSLREHWRVLMVGAIWVGVFASPLAGTVQTLWHNAASLIGAADGYAQDWARPRSGEEALPRTALEIVHLLRKAGATDYRYSDGVRRDELIRQRVVEGAWPIRFDERSKVLVAIKDEATGCLVIYTTKAATLARCD